MILIITKILIRQPRNETNIRRQITKQFIIHFVETDKKPKKKIVYTRFNNALILRLYNTRDFDSETIYLKTVKEAWWSSNKP